MSTPSGNSDGEQKGKIEKFENFAIKTENLQLNTFSVDAPSIVKNSQEELEQKPKIEPIVEPKKEQNTENIFEPVTVEIKEENKPKQKEVLPEKKENSLTERLTEIQNGFTEIEVIIRKLYGEFFGKNSQFKPTVNETIGDTIYYLSGKSEKLNSFKIFESVFGTKRNKIPEKYFSENFVPLIAKLTAYYDKKFSATVSMDVLNGITRVLFAVSNKTTETEKVSEVLPLLNSVIEYYKTNGINVYE